VLDDLRSAIARYLPLEAAFHAHFRDNMLEIMWGQAFDTMIVVQVSLARAGVAKSREDGSIVTDLGDGRELVVWPHMLVEPKRKIHARGWLARRGASTKLDGLGAALWQAMEFGDHVPNDLFGVLASKALIRQRPSTRATDAGERSLLQQMRAAVARHERAKLKFATDPSDKERRREDKAARLAVVDVLLEHKDADAIVHDEADGYHRCDLGDGRGVMVKYVLDGKIAKKDRRLAIEWLKGRGKKRLECFVDEVWRVLAADDNLDTTAGKLDTVKDLFSRMARIEITIRRKK
jgi:hypothetical protein